MAISANALDALVLPASFPCVAKVIKALKILHDLLLGFNIDYKLAAVTFPPPQATIAP
jgi:hypothetical protein